MRWLALLTALLLAALLAFTYGRGDEIPFEKITLDLGANEACAFADFNGDGRLDIVSGESWYEAPKWIKHKFRELAFTNGYVDDFSDLPIDVNGDGHVDIVTATWFSRKLVWMENPGRGKGTWKEHKIDEGFPTEFAFLVDLDNDGKARELLPQFGQPKAAPLAWYEIKDGAFVKHIVGPQSIPHGIGAGDVNGDRRNDIITPKGWYEAPPDPRSGQWTWHPDFDLGSVGFIYVLDVNGDGRPDLVTSAAHDYGVFWMERGPGNQWTKRVIDDTWSQVHAMTLIDLNGDGKLDLLTGKRYMAHGTDPGAREPLGVYWYEYAKSPDGKRVDWTKHIIDYSTRVGGGMQIPVADLDKDGDLDFAVAGKSGLFLFLNKTR